MRSRLALNLVMTLNVCLLLPLSACVSLEDQQPAPETVIAKKDDDSEVPLPAEAIAGLAAEQIDSRVTADRKSGLTPDDIEADADPMKIGFETASWALSQTAKSRIADVAETLKGDVSKRLKIDGHCDERGSDAYNQTLSVKRAQAVKKELVRLGVNPKRLKATGFGRRRTLVKGHSEKIYSHNRRVEMIYSN